MWIISFEIVIIISLNIFNVYNEDDFRRGYWRMDIKQVWN